MLSSCDILVVGGGVAGVPAAVIGARSGLDVVLAERDPFLGGSGVTALHRYICGWFPNSRKLPAELLNPGIASEIFERLRARAPGNHPLQMGRGWGVPFETGHLREIYEALARHEPRLSRLVPAVAEAVECQNQRIRSVTLRTGGGSLTLKPKAVIDATGAGAVIRLSDAPSHPAPDPQMSTATIHLENLDGSRELLALKIPWQLGHSGASHLLPFAGFAPGWGERDGFCKFSIPHGIGPEEEIRDRLLRSARLLSESIPEMRDARVAGISSLLRQDGIRLDGEWTLDEKAILQAHKFSDGAVRNAWPIERWTPGVPVPNYEYPPDDDYYEIPCRCLRSRTVSNLFAAGRCISAESGALGSIRPMGTCMALGEAAAHEAIRWCRAKS